MSNLTYAPLPKWQHVCKAIVGSSKSDKELEVPWRRNGEECFWLSRSSWSLSVISKFRMHVKSRNNICVWLPGYFCNTSIAPLRDLGATLLFYPILKDGNPDLSVFDKMLDDGVPDLIVSVHYFGKPTLLEGLREFSAKTQAWLVEDAAHILRPVKGVGQFGDFVLYSPHKFFPIPDGGLLVSRATGPSKITKYMLNKFNFKSIYSSVIDKGKPSNIILFKWVLKRLLQKYFVHTRFVKSTFVDDITFMNARQFIHPKMSQLSKRLLILILPKLNEESHVRKRNEKIWLAKLSDQNLDKDGVKLFTESQDPYLAGFECNSMQIAENISFSLQKNKIPVSTWPDLPPEVLADKKKHHVAIKMRLNRFYLPVHSSLLIN